MQKSIRDIESEALAAQNAGDYSSAVRLWQEIISCVYNWEHGDAHYNLANCLFELERNDEAEEHYLAATKLAPEDDLFADSLASFREARRKGYIK